VEYKQPEESARLHIPWDEKMALSKSGVLTYEQCPYRFLRQVINEEPIEKSPEMLRGNMFHDGVYALYDNIDTEAITTPGQLRAAYEPFWEWWVSTLPPEFHAIVTLFYKKFIAIEEIRLRNHIEQGKRLIRFWPVHKEVEMYDEELQFYGTCDRIDHTGKKYYVVLDYKTGKYRDYAKSKHRFELAGYAHLAEKSGLVDPKTIKYIGMVFLGGPEEDPYVFYEELGFRTKNAFMAKVKRVRERIKNGEFDKKPSQLCGWCPYQLDCSAEDAQVT